MKKMRPQVKRELFYAHGATDYYPDGFVRRYGVIVLGSTEKTGYRFTIGHIGPGPLTKDLSARGEYELACKIASFIDDHKDTLRRALNAEYKSKKEKL